LNYRLETIEPGYTKKTDLFLPVSLVYLKTIAPPADQGEVKPGLYLLLKRKGRRDGVGFGGAAQITYAFHWESEKTFQPDSIFRSCLRANIGECEIELNTLLAPHKEHFATGVYVNYLGTRRVDPKTLIPKTGSIMPLYRFKSMDKYCQQQFHLGLGVVGRIDFLIHLAKGLSLLHTFGYVHMDLKPENVLISDRHRPLITDFGLSKKIGALSSGGTDGLRTPQMVEAIANNTKLAVTPAEDVWAFGTTMAHFHGNYNWYNWCLRTKSEVYTDEKRIVAATTKHFPSSKYPHTVIRECLQFNPETRATIDQVIEGLEARKKAIEAKGPEKACSLS